MDLNDPRRRLQVLNNSNPSLRVATAPQQQPTISVAKNPIVQPQISVPQAPQQVPQQPANTNLKGLTMDQGKNKTIFGWNAAALLPKSLEKTYGIKADREINLDHNTFLTQYDKLDEQFKNVYTNQIIEQAKNGDAAAANTLQLLSTTGRTKGNANDFMAGANDKLYGGIGRGLLRGTDFLLPGHNTFGLEQLANEQDPSKTGTAQFTTAGKVGEKFGNVEKGIFDLATLAAGGSAAETAATKVPQFASLLEKLQSGGKVAQLAGRMVQAIPGSLAGSGISSVQTAGKGDKQNVGKDFAIGTAVDLGLPILGSGFKGLKNLFKGGADDAISHGLVQDLIDEVDPVKIEKALGIDKEMATYLANETNPDTVKEILQNLALDPNFKLSDDVIKRLEEEGVTAVKQDANAAYDAQYSDGVITAKNQQALDANVNHELGHAIWQNKLTAEEKALFDGSGEASKQAVGRAGYGPEDINSEDFSDYMQKALTGRIKEVPEELRPVIAKYAKTAANEAEDLGIAGAKAVDAPTTDFKTKVNSQVGKTEILPSNAKAISSYNTPKLVTEYKVGEKVSNATAQGGTIDGVIVKTPDFSKDLRFKGNNFTIKLDDGTTIKTDGAGFGAPSTPQAKSAVPTPEQAVGDVSKAQTGVSDAAPDGSVKTTSPEDAGTTFADNTVYHGKSVNGSETGDRLGNGLYVTTDKNRASGYAKGGAVDEYSLDGVKLAKLDDKIDSKIVDTLKREINDSIKKGDNSYKDVIRLSVGEKKFSASDVESARQFRDEQKAIANKLGLSEDSMPTVRKDSSGDFIVTYIDDTLESLKNIDGNRLFRSLPSPDAQRLFVSAGYDGVSSRGIGGDIESVIYNGNLKKPTPTPQVTKTPTVDPTAALKQEALKYKSADEFVDTNKTIHVPIRDFAKTDSTSWNEALSNVSNGKVSKTTGPVEVVMTPNGYKLVEGNHRAVQALNSGKDTIEAKIISKEGLDAIAKRDGPHIKMGMHDSYTKQQLTDLYNQAHAQSAPVKTKPRVQTQTQTEPLVPAKRPPVTLAQADGGGELMRQGGEVGTPTPKKTSKFASQTVPKSEFVGADVSKKTKENAPSYTPETEKGRLVKTLTEADKQGYDAFHNDVLNRLDQKHIDSQTVADSISLAQRLEKIGGETNHRQAADIYDKVSEHLTRSGQTVQAAAILARRTPDGMKYQALRDLKKAGVEITPEIRTNIDTAVKAVAKTQPKTEARTKAVAKLAKEVEKHIPQSNIGNSVSVWKAGLLSGAKTTEGNIISNVTFGVLKKVSDPVAVVADNAMAVITGKRTTTLTQRGSVRGAKEGFQKGYDTLKTGVDMRHASDKYDLHAGINFKNKTVQKFIGTPAQKVFDFMGAQDQPFYYTQLKNSMYDLAKADGINKGLRGKALLDHMNKTVANPTDALMEQAVKDANQAVLSFDTIASKAISAAKQGIDRMPISDAGKATGKAVIDVLAPFVRVPTAFLSRSIDYTPIGVPKTLLSQVARHEFDQRALSKAIGEGITGTGLIALGAALTNSGQISGDYPTNPKEQARWKAEGIKPNSVKLGGTWWSLNYLGPIGMLFGAGKKFQDSVNRGEGALTATGAAIGGFGQTLLGQSFLQGMSGFIDAAKDPARYLEGYINSQAGSVVPGLVNDFANLTDGFQREVGNGFEAIMNRIPGVRHALPEKQDVYGNKLTQNPLDTVNALRPSAQKSSPVLNEVQRLHNVDPNNNDYQVTPTPVDKSISIGGKMVALTNKQRYDLQSSVGKSTQDAWGQIIKTPEYQKLSDLDKAQALNNARTDATKIATAQFALENNLGKVKLTARQQASASQGLNISNYTSQAKRNMSADDRAIYKMGEADKSALSSDQQKKYEQLKKYVETYGKPIDTPEGVTADTSKAFYQKWNSMTKDDQESWLKESPDDNAKTIAAQINKERSKGLDEIKPSNELSKLYSEYDKDISTHPEYTEVDKRNKAKKFQADAYKLNFNADQRDIYAEGGSADLKTLIDEQQISKEDLDNAIKLDNDLYNSGLTGSLKFSKSFRKSYGYGVPDGGGVNKNLSFSDGSGSNSENKHLLSYLPSQSAGSSSPAPQFSSKRRTGGISFKDVNAPTKSNNKKVTINL